MLKGIRKRLHRSRSPVPRAKSTERQLRATTPKKRSTTPSAESSLPSRRTAQSPSPKLTRKTTTTRGPGTSTVEKIIVGQKETRPSTPKKKPASTSPVKKVNNHSPATTPTKQVPVIPDLHQSGASSSATMKPIAANRENGYAEKSHLPNDATEAVSSNMEVPADPEFEEAPAAIKAYDAIPLLQLSSLPRGGVTMQTKAIGRVQFGIPPETIKDSMQKGFEVPSVYIVPVERFCREMGPALGINLAEFEFPAYFNYFIGKKRCTLVVDSNDAERNIRRVFAETLLGPIQFRRKENRIPYEEEDFAADFPRDRIPDLSKELEFFRIGPDGTELTLEKLLKFCHFETPGEAGTHDMLGVPPPLDADAEEEGAEGHGKGKNGDSEEEEASTLAKDLKGLDSQSSRTPWTYSQARWIGDVATVWPESATEEEIEKRSVPRVEIFKMPGGTEYIVHDIDTDNHIVGKARFSGHVKVSESMGVDGFGGRSIMEEQDEEQHAKQLGREKGGNDKEDKDDDDDEDDEDEDEDDDDALTSFLEKNSLPPTFHPPSFGVTVLGNSYGFDKSGSVSGYVLWINGRGVMIDPPPYSSATLEREGIRPRTIVGIILTHCHADHDAGAFQKVLTGSPVVVITTPTIYKSFIRKYAALSALSPALLRHSHRHKPAIIGRPLRFQGATFHFKYTLHSIPCVGFKVEWRGRSMIFTGDHLNSPPHIDKLQADGVLSKGRADDLRNLPLEDSDLLLHEAGIPPLHTPLSVLTSLPQRVKRRLYVVHSPALPKECELKLAPTGTQGTIRLDQMHRPGSGERNFMSRTRSERGSGPALIMEDDGLFNSPWSSASNEYGAINEESYGDGGSAADRMESSFAHIGFQPPGHNRASRAPQRNSLLGTNNAPPLVSLRPASSTDAWFILNLLSAVPFLTSLSYASTMEVLETARVDAHCKDEVVVPTSRRNQVLCVVWEGTCLERERTSSNRRASHSMGPLIPIRETDSQGRVGAVWHAGDWTGPIALQPDKRLSGESALSSTHDIVAMSIEGVKVITVEFSNLHTILKTGSPLYRKYLDRKNQQRSVETIEEESPAMATPTELLLQEARKNLNVLELLDDNSALKKLSAVQKRHLESLAEGPVSFGPGDRLWRAGAPVDRAFIIVAGTASFVPKRRNAGSAGLPSSSKLSNQSDRSSAASSSTMDELSKFSKMSLGESMRRDAMKAMQELGNGNSSDKSNGSSQIPMDSLLARGASNNPDGLASSLTEAHEYVKLSREFQRRANLLSEAEKSMDTKFDTSDYDFGDDMSEGSFSTDNDREGSGHGANTKDRRLSLVRRRSSRARFANKVLGRLYSRRAFTGGLIFSRGHFLGDVSTMVAEPLLSQDHDADGLNNDENSPKYGFGGSSDNARKSSRRESVSEMVIHEQEGGEMIVHSSTLTAGKEGCVVLFFPKQSLIPFLDEYPGLLLSLLGTQVVV